MTAIAITSPILEWWAKIAKACKSWNLLAEKNNCQAHANLSKETQRVEFALIHCYNTSQNLLRIVGNIQHLYLRYLSMNPFFWTILACILRSILLIMGITSFCWPSRVQSRMTWWKIRASRWTPLVSNLPSFTKLDIPWSLNKSSASSFLVIFGPSLQVFSTWKAWHFARMLGPQVLSCISWQLLRGSLVVRTLFDRFSPHPGPMDQGNRPNNYYLAKETKEVTSKKGRWSRSWGRNPCKATKDHSATKKL